MKQRYEIKAFFQYVIPSVLSFAPSAYADNFPLGPCAIE